MIKTNAKEEEKNYMQFGAHIQIQTKTIQLEVNIT